MGEKGSRKDSQWRHIGKSNKWTGCQKVDKILSRKICPSALQTFHHFFSHHLVARKLNLEMIHNVGKKLSSEKTPQQYASAEQHLPFFHHTCPNRRTSTAPSQSILLTAFKREIGRTKNERNFSSATDCCCCILLYVHKLAAQDPKFSTWKLSLSNAL